MEDKKLFFEPFFKASLITGKRKKEGGCQASGLLVNKVVKFTEVFTYTITSVPLAVAILNPKP